MPRKRPTPSKSVMSDDMDITIHPLQVEEVTRELKQRELTKQKLDEEMTLVEYVELLAHSYGLQQVFSSPSEFLQAGGLVAEASFIIPFVRSLHALLKRPPMMNGHQWNEIIRLATVDEAKAYRQSDSEICTYNHIANISGLPSGRRVNNPLFMENELNRITNQGSINGMLAYHNAISRIASFGQKISPLSKAEQCLYEMFSNPKKAQEFMAKALEEVDPEETHCQTPTPIIPKNTTVCDSIVFVSARDGKISEEEIQKQVLGCTPKELAQVTGITSNVKVNTPQVETLTFKNGIAVSAEPHESNSVINSLKRLERIGNERSETVAKLVRATQEIGSKLFNLLEQAGVEIPTVKVDGTLEPRANHGGIWIENYLFRREYNQGPPFPAMYRYVFLNESKREVQDSPELNMITNATRADALGFAEDISNGLLDKIANRVNELMSDEDPKNLLILEQALSAF